MTRKEIIAKVGQFRRDAQTEVQAGSFSALEALAMAIDFHMLPDDPEFDGDPYNSGLADAFELCHSIAKEMAK